ncbi:MAG: 30S ribosomal protein S4 [Candidatus Yanofskybacteria bacterium CG10_big_fil_rev_8_21_14_0_10_37_15]|uniref:Small ribosomal subunit protein uS4 n=1 Tax=Candidatus Yanofskybacteria bacterium CG10_big_fil_rev_8_21_14_0_10_37_15 TaxID=1975097 RepID=A0A2H0R6S7_9BACT|nr:MAG: 30S ribosomal protein S4 [Candidatus Yanofskybacteria bacterium CG10_big_fil_rev_8_21_14_0_10_37_15]
MARYTGPREKIERRIGEKLYLKGERSYSQKSAMTKKPYPPGMHGPKGTRVKLSEYAQQLKTKQKIRNTYRMLEKQFKKYVKNASRSKKDPYQYIMNRLELRLDNVVFRIGLAQSRDQARQIVNHGHILVNGKKTDIPSFEVRKNDEIKIREGSLKIPYFSSLMPQWIAKTEVPNWIFFDKEKMIANVKGTPTWAESGIELSDIQTIIEYYSR